MSKLLSYRNRRLQVVANEGDTVQEPAEDDDFGTRSKVSLLDQHSELKKKAEGKCVTIFAVQWLGGN